jgi:DNA-binding transcriptional LysR family regulator
LPKTEDSARLVWLDSFVAAATCGNYEEAGREISCAPTTVRRRVEELQIWLRRLLVTDDVPLMVTIDGEAFIATALAVLALIEAADLRTGLSRTRVQADGSVTVAGEKIGGEAVLEIGKAMVASRAIVDSDYVPPPRVSGKDVDMTFYTRDS